jgi:acetyltransferase-like isoleucine patch superfamily enzyme
MRNILRLLRYDWPLHFVLTFTNWLPDNVMILRIRGVLARPFFGKCGFNLRLGRNLTFYNPSKIFLGNNIYIAEGNWFSANEKIYIGDEVIFGPKSVITSSNHTLLNGSYRYGKPKSKVININKGVWIAAHCTITAGSDIGNSTLIAANSVTRGSIPNKVLWGGNPGRIIKQYE